MTTVADSQEVALRLAHSAVSARLAAGTRVLGPASSIAWHLGELGTGQEWRAVVKTRVSRYPELHEHLLSEHLGDNPEITAVEIIGAADTCFERLKRTVEPAGWLEPHFTGRLDQIGNRSVARRAVGRPSDRARPPQRRAGLAQAGTRVVLRTHLDFDTARPSNMALLAFVGAHTRELCARWTSKNKSVVGNLRLMAGQLNAVPQRTTR